MGPFSTSLQAGQSEVVNALPEDSQGQLGTLNGVPPAWTSADPTVVSVVAAPDGLSATISALKAGTVTITVAATSSFANASASGSFTVTVTEGPATQMAFTFGTPFETH